LAGLVFYSKLPEISGEDHVPKQTHRVKVNPFQFPNLILGVIALFFYVGVEVLAGDSIIAYASSQSIPLATAKFFTTLTLSAMIAGYIIGVICIPRFLNQQKALLYSGVLGVIFSIAVVLLPGYASVLSLSLLGIANALVWPAVWPLALANLGNYTRQGAALLIMGIAGGALIPLLYGQLADVFSSKIAYLILLPCYGFIVYYATVGSKTRQGI